MISLSPAGIITCVQADKTVAVMPKIKSFFRPLLRRFGIYGADGNIHALRRYYSGSGVARKKQCRAAETADRLCHSLTPKRVPVRACTGFDGDFEAGEAIRMQCVKWQT